jgi:isocitrate dehydrogenase
MPETFLTDSFRCRFLSANGATPEQTLELQRRLLGEGLAIAKTECLQSFDGKPGYTLAQGQ